MYSILRKLSRFRNSKVYDNIEFLSKNGLNVWVHDPVCDFQIFDSDPKIDLVKELNNIGPYDVTVQVSHEYYKNLEDQVWNNIVKKHGLIIDIKGILPKDRLKRLNINVWRL